MTVTITITDPTADESRAVRAYLDALHGAEPKWTHKTVVVPADQFVIHNPTDHPFTMEGDALIPETEEAARVMGEDPSGAPDFDSAGMPWDERIHASSRATVADGTWRKKRGVSSEEVAAVEAELTANKMFYVDPSTPVGEPSDETINGVAQPVTEVPEAPSPEPAEPVTASAPTPVDADAPEATAPVQEQSAPEVPAAPDSPPPPPAPTANPFLAVMSRIGKSKLDKAKKDELLTAAGALDDKGNPSILVLNKRPELIEGFVALLDSEGV